MNKTTTKKTTVILMERHKETTKQELRAAVLSNSKPHVPSQSSLFTTTVAFPHTDKT